MYTLQIRNYSCEDFEKYLLLRSRFSDLSSLEEVAASLCRPHFCPEKDLFLIEDEGKIIAFFEIIPEPQISRVILDCFVVPEYRQKGLSLKFSGPATQRIGQTGAQKAQVNIPQNNMICAALLEKHGFRPVRHHLEMELYLSKVSPSNQGERRYLAEGQEEDLARLQNRCFIQTWGYNPNTTESIRYYLNLPGYGPQNVVLLYLEDKPVAYCWCKTDDSTGQGRIYMLGVRPEHRIKGWGKEILSAGLAHLKNCAMGSAALMVDSQNGEAIALYRSLGFEVTQTTVWYEKSLR